jgi:hypothetical protein
MPYWELVTRSFRISWRHKYLWLLAFFAGEGGGSFNFNSSTSVPSRSNGGRNAPDVGAINQQISQWIAEHVGLILAASVAIILLAIAFFVLAAVCEGAVVRAAAEHDAERPFGLGWAWRAGTATMGAMIVFRLLLLALALPLLIVFVALAIGFVVAISGQNGLLIALLVVFGILFVLASIVYLLLLFFLDRLGTRALVLEQLGAMAALRRAYALITKRLGRLLLVWLVSIAVGTTVGIGLTIVGAILIIPAVLFAIAAYASGSAVWWLVLVFAILVLLPVLLVLSAFLAAQGSTFWTLAYRRMEIDQPAYAHAVQQPPVLPTA